MKTMIMMQMAILMLYPGGSVTTSAPGETTAVAGGADMQGCQCVPDFLIFWQKVACYSFFPTLSYFSSLSVFFSLNV